MGSIHRLALPLAFTILLVGCRTTLSQPPATWDGLEYRPGTESELLYVQPGAHFNAYRTVLLDAPIIAVDSRWDPVGNSIPVGEGVAPRHLSSREVQHIKDTIANECRTILVRQVTAGGYEVVERPADDTVLVTSALANVYMDGTSSGRMTLVMELRDARTGQVLARLVGTKTGELGVLQFPDSVTDSADFQRAIKAWGRRLRAVIDEMSTPASRPEPATAS